VFKEVTVDVALDRRLHAPTRIAVTLLEAPLVDDEEAFEVVGQGAAEDRALGALRTVAHSVPSWNQIGASLREFSLLKDAIERKESAQVDRPTDRGARALSLARSQRREPR